MKNKKFTKQNYAVAGVIEALLLVGLVAVILSVIQFYYIPEVMTQREAEHMDEVANQFSFLKAIIDLQSIEKKDVPISSPITLGSRELPYFVTARALGELRILDNVGNIKVDFASILTLTSIRYEAFNSYFIDQIYALEGGGIIVKQPDGDSVMRVDPTIIVKNETSSIKINITVPKIIGISGKNSTSGYGSCFIRTNYSHSVSGLSSGIKINNNMNITTDYPNAWYESLHGFLGNNVNYEKGSNYVKITPKSKSIYLYYTEIYIYAQISPGWIK
ncbi:MAG: hypothetical protein QHH19_00950 [Candidatus Thermoplasmatota archaeon]|nr:hypothetical protein [Candidatus Thermoplasmatota archaeon]